jgi:zinc/manganese transport system substrate-binding protein
MRTILKTWIAAAFLLAMVLGLGACGSSEGGDSGVFHTVAVAESSWASVVKSIAGPDVVVRAIITNPNADPHEYEPTVDDARWIASSQYVVVNGIGYDSWAEKLIHVDARSTRVLDIGDLLGLDDAANPHQWYSPNAVHRVVARVAVDLAALDPRNAEGYRERGREYLSTGLRDYDALFVRIKREFGGTAIGASESIVEPWAAGAGLRLLTPQRFLEAIAEGNEPTRDDKDTVDAQIQKHEIKVFVYNSQNATPDVQRLVEAARNAHIPVVTVTETMTPEGTTFPHWQERQLKALLAALNRSARS